MPNIITESAVEEEALNILSDLGYKILYGPDIAPDGIFQERRSYSDVVLVERLRDAIDRINPEIPKEAREEALKKVLRSESQQLIINNKHFHKMLVEGVNVEYRRKDGSVRSGYVRLFDFENPDNNDWLAVNQFTVQAIQLPNRRPDIVIFVNGLPLMVIELKNPVDEDATIETAFNQFDTYKAQIPSLFNYNEILVISDGFTARAGTITSTMEWFLPWKTLDGHALAPETMPQYEVLLQGMFNKKVLLDLVRHFIVFEEEKTTLKKLAGYHQYHAVNKAIEKTMIASNPEGDRRCGVVWHTQGSGKSLSMVFYTGKIVLGLNNPTIVVITDTNDLDDQLFETFGRCHEILNQTPVHAESREHLRTLLKVASGGIVFTTIQKFFPEEKEDKHPLLSDRQNIIVIADEAHESQYGFRAKIKEKGGEAYLTYGFAKHMRDALPKASFIGFTGTPIEKADRNTPAVFGEYIDIYDIEQAVKDGATVRIYYESRLVKLELKPGEKLKIDPEFEEVTEGEEVAKKEKLKSKWARLEAIVGSETRVKQIAADIVEHFEKRIETLEGKGMIVCMSRRICIDLHNEIIKLRPKWYHEDDDKGDIKVVMTGSASDGKSYQEHIRNKSRRLAIRNRMKDPNDSIKLVIVRDMFLKGFDAPCLHTMYIDKPMREHGLMQAIARVNRVFKKKPGGLVVDYIGIADELKKALSNYTQSGGHGQPAFDKEEAVALMMKNYEIVTAFFHGFNYKRFFTAVPRDKMSVILEAMDYILKQDDGNEKKERKESFLKYVTELSMAYALAVPHAKAEMIRDDVGFFQGIKACIVKHTITKGRTESEMDSAIKQIISKAIVSDGVIDIFAAAGLKKPDISILSDEFLEEVKQLPQKNLALELLRKLLNDEIRTRQKKNLIQGRSFAEMIENAIKRYQNKSIETVQVIEILIEVAKKMREARERGEKLNLSESELAFYDALEVNDSAVKVLGDDILKQIAQELTASIKKNVSIDWTIKESVQAKIRLNVKKILNKHGYPPDKQETAIQTVLKQAELLCKEISV